MSAGCQTGKELFEMSNEKKIKAIEYALYVMDGFDEFVQSEDKEDFVEAKAFLEREWAAAKKQADIDMIAQRIAENARKQYPDAKASDIKKAAMVAARKWVKEGNNV